MKKEIDIGSSIVAIRQTQEEAYPDLTPINWETKITVDAKQKIEVIVKGSFMGSSGYVQFDPLEADDATIFSELLAIAKYIMSGKEVESNDNLIIPG